MGVKLGNGNWAVKEDKLLAYNDKSGKFFNKEFDFTRGSSATYVAKDGLIKTSTGDTPRIDFSDSPKGALLLEPSSTNLFNYSEDFSDSYWSKNNSTIILFSEKNPKGDLSTYKLTENNSTSSHLLNRIFSITANVDYTLSFFVKKADYDYIQFGFGGNYGNTHSNINLTNGNVESENGQNAKVENFGNGWYRVSATKQASNTTGYWFVTLINSANAPRNQSYQGDGVSGTYIWGAQLERKSFATSYIPTYGNTATRLTETCTNSGSAQDFNSEEGVLYAEFKCFNNLPSEFIRVINLNDGSSGDDNSIKVVRDNSVADKFFVQIEISNTIEVSQTIFLSDSTEFNKIAISYKSGDTKFFVNGVLINTKTETFTLPTLNQLDLSSSQGFNNFQGKIRNLRVYTEALTDAELQELTS